MNKILSIEELNELFPGVWRPGGTKVSDLFWSYYDDAQIRIYYRGDGYFDFLILGKNSKKIFDLTLDEAAIQYKKLIKLSVFK